MDFNLTYRDKPWGVNPPFLAKSGMYLGGEISKEDALGQVFMAGGWDGHVDIPYNEYNMNNVQRRINLHYPECQPFSGYAWFPAATTEPLPLPRPSPRK